MLPIPNYEHVNLFDPHIETTRESEIYRRESNLNERKKNVGEEWSRRSVVLLCCSCIWCGCWCCCCCMCGPRVTAWLAKCTRQQQVNRVCLFFSIYFFFIVYVVSSTFNCKFGALFLNSFSLEIYRVSLDFSWYIFYGPILNESEKNPYRSCFVFG